MAEQVLYDNKAVGYLITTSPSDIGGRDVHIYYAKGHREPELTIWVRDLTEIIDVLVDIIKTEYPDDPRFWPKDSEKLAMTTIAEGE